MNVRALYEENAGSNDDDDGSVIDEDIRGNAQMNQDATNSDESSQVSTIAIHFI